MIAILAAESVTALGDEVRGQVLVAGSHGGRIAAYLGAAAGAHALILNDAGVGKDDAGIAGLADLDAIGMAAATVSYQTARIGDGADMLAHGIISFVNETAARCGVVPGMACAQAAWRLCSARAPFAPPLSYSDGRFLIASELPDSLPEVWALDSIGKVLASDAGKILVIGSHCALHGGRPESALTVDAVAAIFHDAGGGKAGTTRLAVLDSRSIPAAAVSAASARIGDGRSMCASGILAVVNLSGAARGWRPGMTVAAAVSRLVASTGE